MHRVLRDRFSVTLRTDIGYKFRGEFGDPNAYPRPRKELQNLPHMALVTSRKAVVKAGDLVSYNGVQYLLAGQHTLTDTKRFLAVEINDHVKWVRTQEKIDPVTKQPRDSKPATLAEALPVCREPQRSFEEMRFSQSQNRIFTAADIKAGDELGEMKVIRVDELFGIHLAEVA